MTNATNPRSTINAVAGIHNGAVTHHQDHVIVLVSFNTKKIKNRTVPRVPPDVFELSDITTVFVFISLSLRSKDPHLLSFRQQFSKKIQKK